MSSKRWLKAEIRKWVQNDLITPSEGNAILAQYEEESHSYQDIFFIMASLSIGGGLLSLGASFWNGTAFCHRYDSASSVGTAYAGPGGTGPKGPGDRALEKCSKTAYGNRLYG